MPSRWVEDYSQLGVRYPIQQHPLSKIFPVVYQDQLFMHPILLKAPHLIPENRHQRVLDSLNAGNTLASRVSATATPYVTDSTDVSQSQVTLEISPQWQLLPSHIGVT